VAPKVYRLIFNNAVELAGLPARTVPPDLRHTYASRLLHHGCVKELQVRLGDASAKVTLDTTPISCPTRTTAPGKPWRQT
jgi:integrase